jgi:hypothetical protein
MSTTNKTSSGLTLAAIMLAASAVPVFADTAQQSPAGFRYNETTPSMSGMPRLAIGGYDTVAYFTVGKAVPGSLDYQTVWHDARWQFANKEDLDLFLANPEKYAAQYDGHCPWGLHTRAATKIQLILRLSPSSTANSMSITRNTGRMNGARMKVKT